jgi:hypothetical protein
VQRKRVLWVVALQQAAHTRCCHTYLLCWACVADHHADLFWAACGGGAGFAVVTRFEFRTHVLPRQGRVTYIRLQSQPGEQGTIEAVMDFQAALPGMDHRLGLDGQSVGSGAGGPRFSIAVSVV